MRVRVSEVKSASEMFSLSAGSKKERKASQASKLEWWSDRRAKAPWSRRGVST